MEQEMMPQVSECPITAQAKKEVLESLQKVDENNKKLNEL